MKQKKLTKKTITWQIEKRKLSDLKPHAKNPRQFTEKGMKDLEKSINSIGFMQPININQDGTILSGHARAMKLKEMGETEVDVYVPSSSLSLKQEEEVLIRANANTAGVWDFDKLANEFELPELTDWGLEIPNVETLEIEELEAKEDDFDGEPPVNPKTVLGDLYEIGEHRLLCGDSTCSDTVSKLMDGESADIAHNDPPYGMKKEKDGVLNDNLNYSALLDFNKEWIPLQFLHLKDNGSWYCWGNDEPLMDIYSEILKPYIKTQKATFRNLITWDKGDVQGQSSENTRSYARADEKCLFVMCGVQGFNKNADNYFEGFEKIRNYLITQKNKLGWNTDKIIEITGKSSAAHYFGKSQWYFPTKEHYNSIREAAKGDAFQKEYDEIKKEYDEIKKEYYSTRAYFNNIHDNFNNVWHFERTSNKEREGTGEHATPKPLKLCERAIKSSCPDNGLVLDFFLGSGSTMVASHQLKRKCYGIELDPKYCDVIVKRMINLDPSLKLTRNGEDCKNEFTHNND